MDHAPWPDNYQENNFTQTKQSWDQLFGVPIDQETRLAPWKTDESENDTYYEQF
jgi:hypothetical protein